MKKPYSVGIVTLGCRVNQYESDSIMQELSKNGFTVKSPFDVCDFYIINTCSVTQESDRKSRQIIRRCISKNPLARVIVTGCYSQINPHRVKEIEGVDYVFGNNNKSEIAKRVIELSNDISKSAGECELVLSDIYSGKYDTMRVGAPLTRTRAFVKIQDGCDSKCAYCIIPYARGSVRSNAPENVISEVRSIADEGCVEVVMTGIETASYGKDFKNGYSLGDLLAEINKIEGIKRIRLGSLDPYSLTKDFVDKIKSLDKVMPHFHISMQSGCTRVLNLMKRKYNIEMATQRIEYLKSSIPGCMLSADVITGFPGESDDDFEQTLDFFNTQRFLHLHVFPYSKREGTVAYSMPNQVDEHIKKERLHRLEALEAEIKHGIFKSLISKKQILSVLLESYEDGFACGHSEEFIEVKVKCDKSLCGKIVNVLPLSIDGDTVLGDIVL